MRYKQQIIAIRKAEPALSYHEIAARIGCRYNTVSKVCSETGLGVGRPPRVYFGEVIKLGWAAKRARLTVQQIEAMANARHA
jgi:hypothetical protein